ncbi:hypothetical protein BJ684DRAFT_17137 [Piptocephalis cylindrospora]|uniref:Uncharacterized protein n=1 Tax=Piptocephalis cylindrospora TaxID=1907219 RepID=A0A4P9Y0U8_9FUNG|nr:hypothetical protein BJ684DRAFT_17137 [Piptocephalis cylindrospora]|eukprot:RKP12363.1 hypothetical protein BJ684DRAFT_17137 [Piptocephalis cylindrospora]
MLFSSPLLVSLTNLVTRTPGPILRRASLPSNVLQSEREVLSLVRRYELLSKRINSQIVPVTPIEQKAVVKSDVLENVRLYLNAEMPDRVLGGAAGKNVPTKILLDSGKEERGYMCSVVGRDALIRAFLGMEEEKVSLAPPMLHWRDGPRHPVAEEQFIEREGSDGSFRAM